MNDEEDGAKLHFDILDPPRRQLLPLLAPLKNRFYLAGGTALALQKGHRDSIDFDFFTPDPFTPADLQQEVSKMLTGHTVAVTQTEPNTLSLLVDGTIRLSFFTYSYVLVEPMTDTPDLRLASETDIGCMKLSAIINRSTMKDYVDLFVILHDITLADLLKAAQQKFPTIDPNVILKALVYFDDIEDEPIAFQSGHAVSLPELEQFICKTVHDTVLP